ncbi:PTS transporter subunit IIC, partial [Streptomyces lydicus]|uniref:PTS transporter subunit IIC n=1 Tax=Streptomyces lydicus TaxID=47763 RepID=UPI003D9F2143
MRSPRRRKLVPGAVPSLDAPIVFPSAQNAVLIGFLAGFTGGLAALALLTWACHAAFGLALVLPGRPPPRQRDPLPEARGGHRPGPRGAARRPPAR